MQWRTEGGLQMRVHGDDGPTVIVLHGGPAAAGSAAPIARGLAGAFRVLEPWQRGSGAEPLTVARHIADLHEVVLSCGFARPALVGESWGAMLALAYAAAHPESAGPLALVGCGTFDQEARARIGETLEARTTPDLRRRLARLPEECPDPDDQLRLRYELTHALYDYDPLPPEPDPDPAPPFDLLAHSETWDDMIRLQEEGVYPAAFAAIRSPVLMLHGAYDPHPGRMIRDSLMPHLPHLEYREWERCGHRPWAERHVCGDFFALLREWLSSQLHRACSQQVGTPTELAPDADALTPAQQSGIGVMVLHMALKEILLLCEDGKAEQAAALADATFSMPLYMWEPDARSRCEAYARHLQEYRARHPGAMDYARALRYILDHERM